MRSVLMAGLIMVISPVYLLCEDWSQTNVQYLYGNDFDYLADGDRSTDGEMETITIEHIGTWKYGSNFFFIDMASGDFASGRKYSIYAEWAPKISLSKLSETDMQWGPVKDVSIVGEINQGNDFRAYNIGLGLALAVPGFNFFDLHLYHRKDNYNDATFQITTAWNSTFEIGAVPLIFEGFFDYYGTDFGTEIVSQPRLLLDGKVFGDTTKNLQAGVELYYYKSSAAPWRRSVNEAVPQIMVKWIW
ncbi:hypothetical protein ACFLR3_01505 [Campylobacterota bacterium]